MNLFNVERNLPISEEQVVTPGDGGITAAICIVIGIGIVLKEVSVVRE
jgi:hypothetical protein